MSGWQAQQAEMARLKTLMAASFEQSRIPMMLISLPGGLMEIVNRATLEVLGIGEMENPAGKGLGEFRPGYRLFDASGRELVSDDYPLFRASRGESVVNEEYRVLRADGSERWILVNAATILDERGKTLAAFVTFPDISSLKRAEQAVRDSHRQFEAIMDNMDALVYVADMSSYEILFMNRLGRDLYGEYAGRICWQTIQQGQVGPCAFCTNNRLLDAAGRPNPPYVWEFENTVTGKWLRCSDQAIRWTDGRLVRMEIAVDITESKNATVALQESEQRFRKLFEKAPLAYQSLDLVGNILEVNDTWLELFGGYGREEIIGRPIDHFLQEQSLGTLKETFPLFIQSGHMEGPVFEIRRKDGEPRTVTVNGRVAYDAKGEPQRTHCMLTDITERQRVERALREHAQQMEQLYQEQREFAFVASHDLQEPLRKILIFGDRLAGIMKDGNETALDYLARMKASASRMQLLIEGLLDYSRVTLKEKNLQAVSLARVVSDVLSDLEGRVSQTGAGIEVGELPVVEADPLQMHQLFQNLIGNALKFARPDVIPHVRIWAEPATVGEADGFCIRVADNGIGFDERYKDKIFEIFERLDGSRAYEGTGVGLSLCKKIVEQHGGAIDAEGRPGEGSVFSVILPLKHPVAMV
jgi:PAS domain S-box-containing protein